MLGAELPPNGATQTMRNRFSVANREDPNLQPILALLLTTKCNSDTIRRFMRVNIIVPVNIVLWRIFIEHDMSSFILMRGGLETGANVHGHSNFAVGHDVQSKIVYGNYTVHTKAMVWRPMNVYLLENVKPEGYVGGSNARFFRNPQEIPRMHEEGRDRPSIIATAIPVEEDNFDFVMSFTGTLPVRNVSEVADGYRGPSHDKPSYSMAAYYTSFWRIKNVMGRTTIDNEDYMSREERSNVIAMQGHQFLFNPVSHFFDRVVECRGHRKKNGNGSGAAQVWAGHSVFFKDQDWNTYKLV